MNLFDTQTESSAIAAGQAAMAQAEAHANAEWIEAAERFIQGMDTGERFMPDEIVAKLHGAGFVTHDAKAIGPLVLRMARAGFIEHSGQLRPVKTSHGSRRPEWRRTSKEE